jgi:hypothetical protein
MFRRSKEGLVSGLVAPLAGVRHIGLLLDLSKFVEPDLEENCIRPSPGVEERFDAQTIRSSAT